MEVQPHETTAASPITVLSCAGGGGGGGGVVVEEGGGGETQNCCLRCLCLGVINVGVTPSGTDDKSLDLS